MLEQRLLTAQEIADLLGVPKSWVQRETRAERIPHITLGKYKRYQWESVAAWLETQRAGQWRKHRPTVEASK